MHPKRYSTPIASALSRFFKDQNGSDNLSLARLWEQWDTLLGPDITDLICPLGHTRDTLLLGAEDAIVIHEFTYFSDQILERVNGFLGREVFKHIHIELLRGRTPLNKKLLTESGSYPHPDKPENLGQPGALPDDGSPVARAYKAYVRHFQDQSKSESAPDSTTNKPTPS
ncbi:DUF721 domain-containing protein [Desulfoplanes formicivorans]|uniref:RNA-binding protein n=1 Tax=Desulfoplanes formicivorans TaxID=1592317 RepID=A0A194AE43_9BACT|nr:DUF721 domain-containing protein [Desulfoplanes formicivorans]GAU07470.1 hypothetical protein DPF_0152 [Desulfoplanes formicivorans]